MQLIIIDVFFLVIFHKYQAAQQDIMQTWIVKAEVTAFLLQYLLIDQGELATFLF